MAKGSEISITTFYAGDAAFSRGNASIIGAVDVLAPSQLAMFLIAGKRHHLDEMSTASMVTPGGSER